MRKVFSDEVFLTSILDYQQSQKLQQIFLVAFEANKKENKIDINKLM